MSFGRSSNSGGSGMPISQLIATTREEVKSREQPRKGGATNNNTPRIQQLGGNTASSSKGTQHYTRPFTNDSNNALVLMPAITQQKRNPSQQQQYQLQQQQKQEQKQAEIEKAYAYHSQQQQSSYQQSDNDYTTSPSAPFAVVGAGGGNSIPLPPDSWHMPKLGARQGLTPSPPPPPKSPTRSSVEPLPSLTQHQTQYQPPPVSKVFGQRGGGGGGEQQQQPQHQSDLSVSSETSLATQQPYLPSRSASSPLFDTVEALAAAGYSQQQQQQQEQGENNLQEQQQQVGHEQEEQAQEQDGQEQQQQVYDDQNQQAYNNDAEVMQVNHADQADGEGAEQGHQEEEQRLVALDNTQQVQSEEDLPPSTPAPPTISDEVWQTVWTFTSSRSCMLFSHLPNGIQVTRSDLINLLETCRGSLKQLMYHLERFNWSKRRFNTLSEIIPAIHLSIASNTHVSHDIWCEIVKWLTSQECKLFSESKDAEHNGLNITIELLDAVITQAKGVDSLMHHLDLFNKVQRRFETFSEVLPALIEAQKLETHVTQETATAIKSYLANPQVKLFRKEDGSSAIGSGTPMDNKKMKVVLEEENKDYFSINTNESPRGSGVSGISAPSPSSSRKSKHSSNKSVPPSPRTAGGLPRTKTGIANLDQMIMKSQMLQTVKEDNKVKEREEREREKLRLDIEEEDGDTVAPVASPKLTITTDDSSSSSSTTIGVALVPFAAGGTIATLSTPTGASSSLSLLSPSSSSSTSTFTAEFLLIHLTGPELDDYLLSSNGSLPLLLSHLQSFDDISRKFTRFTDIPDAIRDVMKCGTYAGSAGLKEMEEYVNNSINEETGLPPSIAQQCHLFSTVPATSLPIKIDPKGFDHLLHITGSQRALRSLLISFDRDQRKFTSFTECVNVIETAMVEKMNAEAAATAATLAAAQATQAAMMALASPTAAGGMTVASSPTAAGGFALMSPTSNAIAKSSRSDRKELERQLSIAPYQQLFDYGSAPAGVSASKAFRPTTKQLDALLHDAGGISNLTKMFDQFVSDMKRFGSVEEMVQCVSLEKRMEQAKLVAESAPSAFMFSNAQTGVSTPAVSQDAAVTAVSGVVPSEAGTTPTTDDPSALFPARREFAQIQRHQPLGALPGGQLPTPTIQEIQSLKISDAMRATLVTYLSSNNSKLIYHVPDTEISVTPKELDLLIQESRGLELCLDHLKRLDACQRVFGSIAALTHACRVGHYRGYHIGENDRTQLLNHIQSPQCTLFSTVPLSTVIMINGYDLDEILIACENDINSVILHFRQFARLGRKFQSVSELSSAVKQACKNDIHVGNIEREAILSYLTSSSCHLFCNAYDGTPTPFSLDTISGSIFDSIFLRNPGKTSHEIIRAFKKFNSPIKRKFTSFHSLVAALSNAFRTGSFIEPEFKYTMQGYLMTPGVKLLKTGYAWESVRGEEYDDLFLTVGRDIELLVKIMKQLNDSGKLLKSFSKLQPLVAQIRQQMQEKKEEDFRDALTLSGMILPLSSTLNLGKTVSSVQGSLASTTQNLSSTATSSSILPDLSLTGTTYLTFGAGQATLLSPSSTAHQLTDTQLFSQQNPPRISDDVYESVIQYITRPNIRFFSRSTTANSTGLQITRQTTDKLVAIAGGLSELLEHLELFNLCQSKYFNNYQEILPALQAACKTQNHLLDTDVQLIVNFLNNRSEITIFSLASLPLFTVATLPGPTLDGLVIASGSVPDLLHNLKSFAKVKRKFENLNQLWIGIKEMKGVNEGVKESGEDGSSNSSGSNTASYTHLTLEDKEALLSKLSSSPHVPLLSSDLILSGADLDRLVEEGNGMSGLLVYLDRLIESHQQYSTLPSLLDGVKRIRQGLNIHDHITTDVWSAIVAWITSPDTQIFSECIGGVSIDGETLDVALMRTGGLNGLLQKLNELEEQNIRLQKFQHLLRVIPPPPAAANSSDVASSSSE